MPVLAGDGSALVRISGDLVRLEAEPSTLASGPTTSARGITMTVGGDGALAEANRGRTGAALTMTLDRGLTVMGLWMPLKVFVLS